VLTDDALDTGPNLLFLRFLSLTTGLHNLAFKHGGKPKATFSVARPLSRPHAEARYPLQLSGSVLWERACAAARRPWLRLRESTRSPTWPAVTTRPQPAPNEPPVSRLLNVGCAAAISPPSTRSCWRLGRTAEYESDLFLRQTCAADSPGIGGGPAPNLQRRAPARSRAPACARCKAECDLTLGLCGAMRWRCRSNKLLEQGKASTASRKPRACRYPHKQLSAVTWVDGRPLVKRELEAVTGRL